MALGSLLLRSGLFRFMDIVHDFLLHYWMGARRSFIRSRDGSTTRRRKWGMFSRMLWLCGVLFIKVNWNTFKDRAVFKVIVLLKCRVAGFNWIRNTLPDRRVFGRHLCLDCATGVWSRYWCNNGWNYVHEDDLSTEILRLQVQPKGGRLSARRKALLDFPSCRFQTRSFHR